MGSDIPALSADRTCRAGDLHAAFNTNKEVAREHAQRWHLDTEREIDTETRKGPGASSVMGGGGLL